MIKTGIYKLDELLGGGIPEGNSLVYYVQPGVESEIFGLQTIYNTLKCGGTGVFVTSSTSPKSIKDKFKDYGWCAKSFKNNLWFLDSYSPLIGVPSKEKYKIPNPDNIEDFSKAIIDVLKELPPSTIVFGSLSTIIDLCGEKETIEAVRKWNNMARLYNHVVIYNFTAWSYSMETLDLIKRQLFDAVITIGGIAEHVIFSQYFGILKLDWKQETRKTIHFESENDMEIMDIKAHSPRHTPWLEYQIDGANVRILGENNMIGFPSFF